MTYVKLSSSLSVIEYIRLVDFYFFAYYALDALNGFRERIAVVVHYDRFVSFLNKFYKRMRA